MKLPGPIEAADIGAEKWFSGEKKTTFFTALLTGFFTHFMLLTDGMMSQDGLCQSIRYYAGEAEISVGRWGVKVFEQLRANYAVSYLSAVLSIFYVAAAAVLVVSVFRIKSRLGAVITAVAFETAPALVVTMLYEYVSDLDFLALLFAVSAAYLMIRCPQRWIGGLSGAILLMLSMSIYQSYLGFTIGICGMTLIAELTDADSDVKTVLKKLGRYALTVVAGFILYFISVKIAQTAEGIGTSAYYGVSELSIGKVLRSLPSSLSNAYHSFVRYYLRDDYIYNTAWHRDIFFVIFFLVLAVLLVRLVIQNRIYRAPAKLICGILLVLLLPAMLNVIALIVPDAYFYALTSMQMVLLVPFFFVILERSGSVRAPLVGWIGTVALIFVMITYFFADILSYRAMKETYDQALYGADRILSRMEETEGYDRNMPVVFAGWFNDATYPQDQSFWEYSLGHLVTNRTVHADYYANTESIRRFYLQFHGIYMNMAAPALYENVIHSERFAEMGIYPALDSVQVIDGIMVIKMMEEPYEVY